MKVKTILEDKYGEKHIVYNGDDLATASNIQIKYIKQSKAGKLPNIRAIYLNFDRGE